MINALADRFEHSLIALDEMGIQYYLGPNNDTMSDTLYHFNYLVSLITGIFDNLALKTNTHLGINFQEPKRISLTNQEFLEKIRQGNQTIRNHINAYVEFIKLIYFFRDQIIHREGLPKTGFENRGDSNWKANFIKVTDEVKEQLKRNQDQESNYDPFTKWGLYIAHETNYLDPYHFSIEAIKTLTKFVDEYLTLLGYSSFIDEQKQQTSNFTNTLKIFEQHRLGF